MLPSRLHLEHPRIRVFVADDDDDLRELVAETLEADGNTVVTARNGAELLQLIGDAFENASTRPDVVVADVRMPELSGLGVLVHLYRARVRLPMVLMTGFVPDSVATVAKRFGAYRVLMKPFKMDDLVMAVLDAGSP
jgi:two-component system, NtrC family, response regulator AtoC